MAAVRSSDKSNKSGNFGGDKFIDGVQQKDFQT